MADEKKRLTQAEQLDKLMERFDEVNDFFIDRIAEQVLKIGSLIPSNINRLTIMAEMNENIAAINAKLAKAMQSAIPDLYKLYQDALNKVYTDRRFARALQETPLPDAEKRRLEHYAQAVCRQTAGTLYNLSNTTAVSSAYRHTIDNAVLATSSGLMDYKAATRQAVRELGYNGMQVKYASGYRRRLDTAVRQNIVDGMNQIARNGSIMMGEALGYDAYEISAHARSAPDHEPVQGRVFLIAEFEKLQTQLPFTDTDGRHYDAIRRPIGEWNCMHIVRSFSTKYSKRRYTDQQLAQWAADNAAGCEIDGKHYTIYEASQLMRRMETEIRRQKGVANAARAVGDDILRQQCQETINRLSRKYSDVVQASGLTAHRDRMRIEGFKPVKVQKEPSAIMKSPDGSSISAVSADRIGPSVLSKNCIDVTSQWKPGKDHEINVSDGTKYEVGGNTYRVGENGVKLIYSKHEKEVAEAISRISGRSIEMVPTVAGANNGVRTPDYIINGSEKWDLKELSSDKPDAIRNALHRKREQADNFVLDITKNPLDTETIKQNAIRAFDAHNMQFLNSLMIFRDGDIVYVFTRAK